MAKMKTLVGYELVITLKDGSVINLECKDFNSEDGKLILHNVKEDDETFDFAVIVENEIQTYTGDMLYKED